MNVYDLSSTTTAAAAAAAATTTTTTSSPITNDLRANDDLYHVESLIRTRDTPLAMNLARVLIASMSAAGSTKTLVFSLALQRRHAHDDAASNRVISVLTSATTATTTTTTATTTTDVDDDERLFVDMQRVGKPVLQAIESLKMF